MIRNKLCKKVYKIIMYQVKSQPAQILLLVSVRVSLGVLMLYNSYLVRCKIIALGNSGNIVCLGY